MISHKTLTTAYGILDSQLPGFRRPRVMSVTTSQFRQVMSIQVGFTLFPKKLKLILRNPLYRPRGSLIMFPTQEYHMIHTAYITIQSLQILILYIYHQTWPPTIKGAAPTLTVTRL